MRIGPVPITLRSMGLAAATLILGSFACGGSSVPGDRSGAAELERRPGAGGAAPAAGGDPQPRTTSARRSDGGVGADAAGGSISYAPSLDGGPSEAGAGPDAGGRGVEANAADSDAGSTTMDGATAVAPREPTWADRVRAGRAIFERACARCHPGGRRGIGPTLRGKALSPRAVRSQIRRGKGRMRAIPASRLPEADLRTLMAYLASLGTIGR